MLNTTKGRTFPTNVVITFVISIVLLLTSISTQALTSNSGFEDGDFTDWTLVDLTDNLVVMAELVSPGSSENFAAQITTPSQGGVRVGPSAVQGGKVFFLSTPISQGDLASGTQISVDLRLLDYGYAIDEGAAGGFCCFTRVLVRLSDGVYPTYYFYDDPYNFVTSQDFAPQVWISGTWQTVTFDYSAFDVTSFDRVEILLFDDSSGHGPTILQVDNLTISGAMADQDGDGIEDSLDNCPAIANPLEACMSGTDCLGPTNSCNTSTGLCTEQDNVDGDSQGDVCDTDDDNDGIDDQLDNCPINSNPFQEDDDFDGLGNACDSTFNEDSVSDQVEEQVTEVVEILADIQVSGGNGMISKLAGNGGVTDKVANAVDAYDAGLIDLQIYIDELNAALDKLGAFENQLNAKINNGKIVDPEATQMMEALLSMESTIQTLLDNAGP